MLANKYVSTYCNLCSSVLIVNEWLDKRSHFWQAYEMSSILVCIYFGLLIFKFPAIIHEEWGRYIAHRYYMGNVYTATTYYVVPSMNCCNRKETQLSYFTGFDGVHTLLYTIKTTPHFQLKNVDIFFIGNTYIT